MSYASNYQPVKKQVDESIIDSKLQTMVEKHFQFSDGSSVLEGEEHLI